MADTRETLLARLLTVAKAIKGVETCERNLDDLADISLPAIILFDGGEETFENEQARGLAPNTVEMQPTFDIYVQDVPETIGTTINGWRTTLLKAILSDATIAGDCGNIPNAGVRYLGCETSSDVGRSSTMRMTVSFAIKYGFKPSAF